MAKDHSSPARRDDGRMRHLLEGIGREKLTVTDVKVTRLSWSPPEGTYC